MGINQLHVSTRSIQQRTHLSQYASQRAAVDAYAWLHRGALSCAAELCQGLPTDKFIRFCIQRIELLQKNGITPVMVFDGAPLPMKANEGVERAERRNAALAQAKAAHEAGGAAGGSNVGVWATFLT